MSGLKIKVRAGKPPTSISQSTEPGTSTRKRKAPGNRDSESYVDPAQGRAKSKRRSTREKARKDSEDERGDYDDAEPQLEARREQEEEEEELDIEGHRDDRGILPFQGSTSPLTPSRSPSPIRKPSPKRPSREASEPTTRRRSNKGRKSIVFSDDDDDYDEPPAANATEDRDDDDDFLPLSPPSKKAAKKGAVGTRLKGKATAKSSSLSEIKIKDERKVSSMVTTSISMDGSSTTLTSLAMRTEKVVGVKRRREEEDEKDRTVDVESMDVTQGSSSTPASEAPSAPPVKKKLPPIKKKKPTVANSGPSTPAASSASTPLEVNVIVHKKPPVGQQNTDLDLTNSDIYKSLFNKPGVSTPQAGVLRREKDEERRKELKRMREAERSRRLADLDKGSFDLLAAQEKISDFETRLKARNSPALYPQQLCFAYKQWIKARNERAKTGIKGSQSPSIS